MNTRTVSMRTVLFAIVGTCLARTSDAAVAFNPEGQLLGATNNAHCPSASDCVSMFGFCGSDASYCAPGACIAGPCWASEAAGPGSQTTSKGNEQCLLSHECVSQYGFCGVGPDYCGSGCQGGPCETSAAAAAPTSNAATTSSAAPTALDALAKPTVSKNDKGKRICTVTESFDKPHSTSVFAIDFCRDNLIYDGGVMSMKLVEDPTCKGPRMSSRQSYKRGVMEARLKSAPGHGVVTSAIWQSTPLEVADELDWEFRGKNGLESSVDSNIYVDGVHDWTRAGKHKTSTPHAEDFHTYIIDWNERRTIWKIDGKEVRRVKNDGSQTYPTKPMHVKLSLWDGSQTSDWAGDVDFSQGPFLAEFDYVKIEYPCEDHE